MSLSENLYNLGTLMKTNLEKQWVTGLTGNEGLTTLANKILDISSQEGVTLQLNTLDSEGNIIPPIVQKDQDYQIIATLLNNKRPMVGQMVRLNYYLPSFKDDPLLSGGEYNNSTLYAIDGNGTATWDSIGEGEGYVIFTALTTIDGKVLKKRYEVLDGLAVDIGTTDNHNDIWHFNSTYKPTLTRTNDYSIVGQQTSGTAGQISYSFGEKTGLIIEFDVQFKGSDTRISLRQGTAVRNIIQGTYGDLTTGFNHFIIDFDNRTCTCTTTGVTKTISSETIGFIMLEARGTDGEVWFKNFVVYPSA